VTVGAGMISGPVQSETGFRKVTAEERAARFGQKAITVWLTGADRHDMAYALERALFDVGHPATVLADEAFGAELLRAAQLVNHAGLICLCPLEHGELGSGEGRVVLSVDGRDVSELIESLRQQGILA
ncbi:MAG: sulfate adenylyltransferase subunit CysN, partial [Methylococcus sp.]|nr:sulfate adenylyltransferase subunit CysN [Methylococcus sp.]